ncbi:MAG: T9SS type A sorting domain-containing protein, partial [Chitinophagaceae bacterium]|nr:T9SS type A sorting domain-containing protein [Chitinophagaceae bacterium]
PSDSSHVNGKVLKQGLGSFIYPVGNGIRYQPIAINLSDNSDGMYVRYNTGNAGANPYTANGSEATPLIAFNANEFWNCDVPFGGVATGIVTMYWDDYNNTGIGNITALKVAHLSNSEWVNEGTTATGTIAAGSVTSNVLNSWSPFTLGSISMSSPLPVTLLSFTGNRETTANVLNWTTSMEQNNAYFHVQRSQDARNFTTIAKVNTKAINGNSSTMLRYELQDEHPSTGNNYYRLEQVDLDGNSSYSEVINLYRDANGNIISIYPNPTKGMLYVECLFLTEGEAAIILSDLSGRKIKEIQMNTSTGSNTISFDMSDVSIGMYLLKVSQGNQVISIQKIEKCE